MSIKAKRRLSLAEYLARAAESLYPDQPARVIDVNARDVDGDTPLHKAAGWGDVHAVRLFIEGGAQVDVPGDMGCTPLYIAVARGHWRVAELLLKSGANPDTDSELGFSPRTLAAVKKDEYPDPFKLLRDWPRS